MLTISTTLGHTTCYQDFHFPEIKVNTTCSYMTPHSPEEKTLHWNTLSHCVWTNNKKQFTHRHTQSLALFNDMLFCSVSLYTNPYSLFTASCLLGAVRSNNDLLIFIISILKSVEIFFHHPLTVGWNVSIWVNMWRHASKCFSYNYLKFLIIHLLEGKMNFEWEGRKYQA